MNRFLSGILTVPLLAAQGYFAGLSSPVGVTVAVHDGKSDFVVVRPSGAPFAVTAAASELLRAIKSETGAVLAQYTAEKLPSSNGKEPRYIRIGFSEDAEKRGISLSYRDFAVFADDGNFCITAGSEKTYAAAVDFITDEYLRDDSLIIPNAPYVFHADYAFENRTLFGKKLYDIPLVYENSVGKDMAQRLADTVLAECGKMPTVTDKAPTDGVFVRFGAENAPRDAYRVAVGQNSVSVESANGEGLEKAAALLSEKLFEQTDGEAQIMSFEGKIEKTALYEKEITHRAPLADTLYKAEHDRKLRVAYFGGSVTVGYGATDTEKYSWRARTTAWLKKTFPDTEITEINAAIGASGSYLGSFRTQRDILSQKPDLLFVEFAINDVYNGESLESAEIHYESIIRRVRTENPTCDIVAVYTTDSGRTASGGDYMQQKGHDKIAALYDVPSVNIGRALTRSKNLSGAQNDDWKKYFIDIVHMTDEGYRVYADVITEFLRDELVFAECPSALVEHAVPTAKHAEALLVPQYDVANETMLADSDGWSFENGTFQGLKLTPYGGYLYTTKKDNRLSHTFTGNELAVFLGDYTNGTIRVSIDGGDAVSVARSSMNNPLVLVKNLPDGTHTVTLSVEFSDKTSSSCKIGAFLPRVYGK